MINEEMALAENSIPFQSHQIGSVSYLVQPETQVLSQVTNMQSQVDNNKLCSL